MSQPNTPKHKKRVPRWVTGLIIGLAVIGGILAGLLFFPFSPLRAKQEKQYDRVAATEAQGQAFLALEKASLDPVSIRYSNGFPRSVYVRITAKGDDAYERASWFMDTYADLYLQGNPDFRLEFRSLRGEADELVVYYQTYQGVPVFGSEVVVQVDKDQVVSTLGGLLTQPANTVPVLTDTDAEWIVFKDLNLSVDSPSVAPTRLEIYDPSLFSETLPDPRLVWHVFPVGASLQYLVDARTGEVVLQLATSDLGYELDLEDANYSRSNNTECYWLTTNDDTIYDGEMHTGDDPGEYGSDREALAILNLSRTIYDFYLGHFSRDSFDSHGGTHEVYVHAGVPNAQWDGGCNIIEFADREVGLDVFGHEFTHGVHDFAVNFIYLAEPGALDESYADIFGSYIDGNWLMGDANVLGPITYKDLSNPPRFGDPDVMPLRFSAYTEPGDWGGVHTNSTIVSKAAWLIDNGGTHNGITVSPGLGAGKALILFYVVSTSRLTTNASFMDNRDAMVRTAEEWAGRCTPGSTSVGRYGFTRQDVCSVKNAFASVGLGNPDANCDCQEEPAPPGDRDRDTVPDLVDNCPDFFNPDQHNMDGDIDGDVCDEDRDGDGRPNNIDNCPDTNIIYQDDWDGDGIGSACEDSDRDGVVDLLDNCYLQSNPNQSNLDSDRLGDVCDNDADGDNVESTGTDNCPMMKNSDQTDLDEDGVGDACDNCLQAPNGGQGGQTDRDHDGIGDACDTDADNDGIPDKLDNCVNVSNRDQFDLDGNGIGTVCDVQETLRTFRPAIARVAIQDLTNPLIRRIPMPEPTCPSCADPHVFPQDVCFDLLFEDLSPQVLPFITDSNGQLVVRGRGNGTQITARFHPNGGTEYFLNFAISPQLSSAGPLEFGMSLNQVVCNRPTMPAEVPVIPTVGGTVYVDLNGDGDAVDEGEGPLAGTNVTISGCMDSSLETGPDGTFYFMAPVNGACLVSVEHMGLIFLSSDAGSGYPITTPLDRRFTIYMTRDQGTTELYMPGIIQSGPAPTCEDQPTYDACKAFGGCYWWSTGGCYSYPEPPSPSCSDYTGNPAKCKDAGCNYWSDGTCSEDPEPAFDCHQYDGDDAKCNADSRCKWDGSKYCDPN